MMIRYDLICERDHEFEGWFGSSLDFDRQSGEGLLSCPICGSDQVGKALMSPSIASSGRSADEAEPDSPAERSISGLPEGKRALLGKIRELRRELLDGAENVEDRFCDEARRIHYGESPGRAIYGKADPSDAADLLDEGIEVTPLPDLPEDRN